MYYWEKSLKESRFRHPKAPRVLLLPEYTIMNKTRKILQNLSCFRAALTILRNSMYNLLDLIILISTKMWKGIKISLNAILCAGKSLILIHMNIYKNKCWLEGLYLRKFFLSNYF